MGRESSPVITNGPDIEQMMRMQRMQQAEQMQAQVMAEIRAIGSQLYLTAMTEAIKAHGIDGVTEEMALHIGDRTEKLSVYYHHCCAGIPIKSWAEVDRIRAEKKAAAEKAKPGEQKASKIIAE